MLKISENIACLRKKKGITQDELAGALNVSNQAVSKWEAGRCCPDIELLPALACFFGVSVDSLLVGDCADIATSDPGADPGARPETDDILARAIALAQKSPVSVRISTSVLQRKMHIGYGTAKQILEELTARGYASPGDESPGGPSDGPSDGPSGGPSSVSAEG